MQTGWLVPTPAALLVAPRAKGVGVEVSVQFKEPIMRTWKVAVVLAVLSLLVAFALAAAQEPVKSFDQLNTRLKPGDTIWVTDAQGRELKGEIGALEAGAVTFRGERSRTFTATDVRQVTVRQGDSLGNGALIGLAVGGLGTGVLCVASVEDQDRGWCALAALFYGGIGAGIGVGIDALIPGKKLVVYRAPGSGGTSSARLSIAPLVTRRAKGAAVSFSF